MNVSLSRINAAARYLRQSAPVYKWGASIADCPFCGRSVFLSLQPNEFMTRCLRCRANITGLSPIPVIQSHFASTAGKRVYEMSSYGITLAYLRRAFTDVTISEYMPNIEPGSIVDGTLIQDVQRLTFADESFDLITSNQVFEHVPDDIQGFRECLRTLRRGGALIFTVPLHDIPKTKQLAKLTNSGVVHLQAPEYHSSRKGGAYSELTFWHHSMHDIADRVKQAGFDSVSVAEVLIAPCQRRMAKVVYAIRF
jgi:SAM-dependent methyltransferase